MYKKRKNSFFKQLGISIFKPMNFGELLLLKMGKTMGYLFLFCLLLSTVITLIATFQIMVKDGGIASALNRMLPEFLISNGELNLDESYSLNTDKLYIYADDEIEQFNMSDLEYVMNKGEHNQILLISKTNLIMSRNDRIQNLIFAEQFSNILDKQTAINFIVKIFIIIIACFLIFSCPLFFILHLLVACIIFILAAIMNAILSKKATGLLLYQMSLYIAGNLTIALLLLNWLPFYINIKYKLVIFAAISIFYLFFAVPAAGVIVSREKNLRSAGYYHQNYTVAENNALDLKDDTFSKDPIQ